MLSDRSLFDRISALIDIAQADIECRERLIADLKSAQAKLVISEAPADEHDAERLQVTRERHAQLTPPFAATQASSSTS